MAGWTIECPDCGYSGTEDDYQMSLADEIFCPKCGWAGILSTDDDDDDYEDEELSDV